MSGPVPARGEITCLDCGHFLLFLGRVGPALPSCALRPCLREKPLGVASAPLGPLLLRASLGSESFSKSLVTAGLSAEVTPLLPLCHFGEFSG